MSAPAIYLVLELEAAPRVVYDWLHEGDEVRMRDWLAEHPEQQELVERALELQAAA